MGTRLFFELHASTAYVQILSALIQAARRTEKPAENIPSARLHTVVNQKKILYNHSRLKCL
jgi:hypothetical protein